MNYFAHAFRFLDDPYFVAGTALPDWLSVVARRVRCQSKRAQAFFEDDDARMASLARGVVQHHRDDAWFHQTAAFVELSLTFSRRLRHRLPAGDGIRTGFVGHLLVEVLLDAVLIEPQHATLDRYYEALEQLEPAVVAAAVERMAGKSASVLIPWIPRFSTERFLYDYLEDAKLLARINQVMRRVNLAPLPQEIVECIAEARRDVSARTADWFDP